MLTRRLQRALLDTRWQPPTFLLPWAANLTTVSHTAEAANVPPPLTNAAQHQTPDTSNTIAASRLKPENHDALHLSSASTNSSSPLQLSSNLRELLPTLRAQKPHYMTAHIHDKPYLITQGDTVRLPYLMHGVEPGDILRLTRASNIGSRDYTLKAAASGPKLKSPTTDTTNVLDPTSGHLASESRVMPEAGQSMPGNAVAAPHFIPHIAKGKHTYLDDRMFVCRAVVIGVESEPMRIKEKTKRRQRKVKHVRSKHKFTVLKIKELRIRTEEEIDSETMG